jgi:hypothetical protein
MRQGPDSSKYKALSSNSISNKKIINSQMIVQTILQLDLTPSGTLSENIESSLMR